MQHREQDGNESGVRRQRSGRRATVLSVAVDEPRHRERGVEPARQGTGVAGVDVVAAGKHRHARASVFAARTCLWVAEVLLLLGLLFLL